MVHGVGLGRTGRSLIRIDMFLCVFNWSLYFVHEEVFGIEVFTLHQGHTGLRNLPNKWLVLVVGPGLAVVANMDPFQLVSNGKC